ncbi:MAG: sensor hybrid histidine kinase [Chlorobi bacterium]|nr:sensor hybrid histidine kinase [Chlorobiota bacterium]
MSTPTVLNVDDNDAGRYAVSRILQLAGFQVREAATGHSALDVVSEEPPQIILLDINLPDINGFEVCRRIKSTPATANIPVLMMSASFIRDRDRVRGLDGGADGYLAGPLEPEVLIATVQALLRVRKAEDDLQISARQWQTTFNAIGDGVALIDENGAVLQCNDAWARILGKSRDEIIGLTCAALFDPDNEGICQLPCTDPAQLRQRSSSDLLRGESWLQISSDPIYSQTGAVEGCVCIISDITQRKHAEQELQRAKEAAEAADHAKDQFLAVLSHELRTPLTPVLTAVQALHDETGMPDRAAAYIEIIHRNVELEARLIDDLLDLTRIAREKLQINLEAVDAHSLLRNVLEICQADISEKKMKVTIDLTAKRHHVHADSARLQQVFWNLIKNAVKFTPDGGELAIRTSNSHPDELAIQIIDSGIGIEPHILPRIFDAFEQGEQSITRQFGGLGLGLAITKALVDMHGGTLEATSQGKDQGATFLVRLKAVDATGTASPAPQAMPLEQQERLPVRILLVDDHLDTSKVMQILLERRGYQVDTAHSVQSALDLAGQKKFDLLISDIGLPDGSGLDLMRAIHANYDIKGIALSGFGMEDDIQKSKDAGFIDHLTKPVGFNKLHEVIQQLTER